MAKSQKTYAAEAASCLNVTDEATGTSGQTGTAGTQQIASNKRHSRSPLLELPPELRDRIWELVVVEDAVLLITKPTTHDAALTVHNDAIRLSRMPGIVHASTETRAEALPIFAGRNTFRIHVLGHCKGLRSPFFGLVDASMPFVRRVEVSGCKKDNSKSCRQACHVSLDGTSSRAKVKIAERVHGIKHLSRFTCLETYHALSALRGLEDSHNYRDMTVGNVLRTVLS